MLTRDCHLSGMLRSLKGDPNDWKVPIRMRLLIVALLLAGILHAGPLQSKELVIGEDWESGIINSLVWTQDGDGAYLADYGYNSNYSAYFGGANWGDVKSIRSFSFLEFRPELEFWARTMDSVTSNNIGAWLEGPAGASEVLLGIYIRPESDYRIIECYAGTQENSVEYPLFEDSVWHHYNIFINLDGTASFFKDGLLIWHSVAEDWTTFGEWKLRLSGYNNGGAVSTIDEIALYDWGTDDVVARYPFNGNAEDTTGNGNDGTVYEAIPASDRLMNSNSALKFDGIDDNVDLSKLLFPLVPNTGTIAVWFMVDSLWGAYPTNWQAILTKSTFSTNVRLTSVGVLPDGAVCFVTKVPNDGSPWGVEENAGRITRAGLVEAGKWYHLAITADGTHPIKIYINGVEQPTSPTVNDSYNRFCDYGSTWAVGKMFRLQDNPGASYFGGCIDDLRFYSRALSWLEVATLAGSNGTIYISPTIGCVTVSTGRAFMVPVNYRCVTPSIGMTASFKWTNPNVVIDSVTRAGTATESWSNADILDNTNHTVVLAAWDQSGQELLPGWDTTLAYIYFHGCGNGVLDTAYSEDPAWGLLFADTNSDGFVPYVDMSEATIEVFLRGDMKGDCTINILDITYLVSYLYKGGPAPIPDLAGDANGSGNINMLDLTYIIAYLFKGGPEPVCNKGKRSEERLNARAAGEITASFRQGGSNISIHSTEAMAGIELTLNNLGIDKPKFTSLVDGVEIYYHQIDSEIKLGMVDITGQHMIPAGKHNIIEVDGPVEIVRVLGADENSNGVTFEIVNQAVKEEILPREYSLAQNHPNPFNPATTIEFSLPKASDVLLEVYNISGQKVATLVNSRLEAGYHSVTWDSRNTTGEPLASGIYLYRLKADTFVETKKMMLLK